MAMVLRPGQIFEAAMTADENLPAEQQAKFSLRAGSGREQLELADELAQVGQDDVAKRIRVAFAAIRRHLVGWKNVRDADGRPVPFDADKIEDVLSWQQAAELAYEVVYGLSADDLGNSASPRPSGQDASARPDSAGSATAAAAQTPR